MCGRFDNNTSLARARTRMRTERVFNMVPRESWQASSVAERGARTAQKRRGAAPRRAFFAFIGSPPRYC